MSYIIIFFVLIFCSASKRTENLNIFNLLVFFLTLPWLKRFIFIFLLSVFVLSKLMFLSDVFPGGICLNQILIPPVQSNFLYIFRSGSSSMSSYFIFDQFLTFKSFRSVELDSKKISLKTMHYLYTDNFIIVWKKIFSKFTF